MICASVFFAWHIKFKVAMTVFSDSLGPERERKADADLELAAKPA